jgi:hypothetical protein
MSEDCWICEEPINTDLPATIDYDGDLCHRSCVYGMVKVISYTDLMDVDAVAPPFEEWILFETRDFMCVGRVLELSPNDDNPGSEYEHYTKEKGKFSRYQFYIQPMTEGYIEDYKTHFEYNGDSDFLMHYSDSITAWCFVV